MKDASPDEIRGKIQLDVRKSDEELAKQAAAFVEKIRMSTIQKIAESRSQGTQVSHNQRAAQESEILKYVEKTLDTSALDLLRDPSSPKGVPPPPPHKRTGPPPPWEGSRCASRRVYGVYTSKVTPKWNHNGPPSARYYQTLKRSQPHQEPDNIPRKLQNKEPGGESNGVSSTTPINHDVQEPRREIPVPADVNPATSCFEYLQSLNPGNPVFKNKGYRERKVLQEPAQSIQTQQPVVSNEIRNRQVTIEPPNSSNQSPQFRVVNPVTNAATTLNSPNVQNSIRSPTEKELVPYNPQKPDPYVPTTLRKMKSNENSLIDPADEIPNGRSKAEKNRDEHIAMAKEIKQEAIDEEEAVAKVAAPAVVDHSPSLAPVPVKQSFKPASMPGLITPHSLFNGAQWKKGQRQMKQVTDEIVSNNKKQLVENANFQQPIKVIWKNKSINLPEYTRCELCKGLMSLWIELRDAHKNYNRLFPAYKCKGCPSVRSIASKFDPNEEIAESSWPSVKINSPVKIVRDFDDELNSLMGLNFLEREQKRQEKTKKRSRRNKQHPEVAREASTTSDPQIVVAENPRMQEEMANIISKKIEVGDTKSYSLWKLIQKILVVSGRAQSEDETFDPEIMHDISANEFMETMSTFLMSQKGFPNTVFVKDD